MYEEFDPFYFCVMVPGLLLGAWAQWRVGTVYLNAGQCPALSGVTGEQAAADLLDAAGVHGVRVVESSGGLMSDHYDASQKVLCLSEGVFHASSLASLGIAAHEAGHALQQAKGSSMLRVRSLIVRLAHLGTALAWVLVLTGFFSRVGGIVWAGIGVYLTTVVLQLINLPLELDASRRAQAPLLATGAVGPGEQAIVRRVMKAAALTSLAATLTGILGLLDHFFRAKPSERA